MMNHRDVITSRDNPSVKHFRKLLDSKKERSSENAFVIEGKRLVLDAFKSGADIERVFITCAALGKYGEEIGELYTRCNVTVISDEIGRWVSDTDNTQGIFAKCSIPQSARSLPALKAGGRYAVMSKVRDPGNVGMIIRTADAFGIDGAIFSESCDIFNPKTVRSTMGSIFRLPVYCDISAEEIFHALECAGLPSFAAVVDREAEDIRNVDLKGGGAVFIGNEANGLDRDIKERCTQLVTIGMNGNAESLNAAMAAGIIMWELVR